MSDTNLLNHWERSRFFGIERDAEDGLYPTMQDMDFMIRLVKKLAFPQSVVVIRRKERDTVTPSLFA